MSMVLGEIGTAVAHQIPTVAIVMNNGSWGAEKAYQRDFYGERYIGADIVNPRFDLVAESVGARGAYVERPEQIGQVVRIHHRAAPSWPMDPLDEDHDRIRARIQGATPGESFWLAFGQSYNDGWTAEAAGTGVSTGGGNDDLTNTSAIEATTSERTGALRPASATPIEVSVGSAISVSRSTTAAQVSRSRIGSPGNRPTSTPFDTVRPALRGFTSTSRRLAPDHRPPATVRTPCRLRSAARLRSEIPARICAAHERITSASAGTTAPDGLNP